MLAVIALASENLDDTLQLEEREIHFAKWHLQEDRKDVGHFKCIME